MATRKHCDICDETIRDKSGGTLALKNNFDGTQYAGLDDLCQNHLNSLKRPLANFKAFQQGAIVEWPTERTTGG